jgi:hypothetical protein
MASVAGETEWQQNSDGERDHGAPARRRRASVAAREISRSTRLSIDKIRWRIAWLTRLTALACSGSVVLAALLVALQDNVNLGNAVVEWFLSVANALAGPFGDLNGATFRGGIFDLKNTSREALANWGMAGLIYFVGGGMVARVLRPLR